jgi:hypothetical protein
MWTHHHPPQGCVKSIVTEKELRLREGMALLGLRSDAYWASWFLTHWGESLHHPSRSRSFTLSKRRFPFHQNPTRPLTSTRVHTLVLVSKWCRAYGGRQSAASASPTLTMLTFNELQGV